MTASSCWSAGRSSRTAPRETCCGNPMAPSASSMRASAVTSHRAATTRARRAFAGAIGVRVLLLSGTATIVVAEDQPQPPAAPAPTATPSKDQPKKDAKAPQNVELLPSTDAASALGKKVKGPNG